MAVIVIILIMVLIAGLASGSGLAWLILLGIIIAICVGVYSASERSENALNNSLNQTEELKKQGFNTLSTKVRYTDIYEVLFDRDILKMAICYSQSGEINILDFFDIIEVEIMENGSSVSKGGIGRAIVGGVLAGGVGAIVGASTSKQVSAINSLAVKIITKKAGNSLILLPLISTETKSDSVIYKSAINFAQALYAEILSAVQDKNDKITFQIDDKNIANQIRELAKLKEEGLITEEEFNKKKNLLLFK